MSDPAPSSTSSFRPAAAAQRQGGSALRDEARRLGLLQGEATRILARRQGALQQAAKATAVQQRFVGADLARWSAAARVGMDTSAQRKLATAADALRMSLRPSAVAGFKVRPAALDAVRINPAALDALKSDTAAAEALNVVDGHATVADPHRGRVRREEAMLAVMEAIQETATEAAERDRVALEAAEARAAAAEDREAGRIKRERLMVKLTCISCAGTLAAVVVMVFG